MAFKEIFERAKEAANYALLAGMVCGIGYIVNQEEMSGNNKRNFSKLANMAIILSASQDNGSNGGVVEIKNIRYLDSEIEDEACADK